ncbi:lactoylglutathione lyase [Zoogloeaceae bacterium G21618-S1]|nr:lactoylglutathione lyase [Zoogloeaceae bacterium G21618-S1]
MSPVEQHATGARRLLHTMLRVSDLARSLAFYIDTLSMRLLRRRDYPDGRFTLAFVGYADEAEGAVLELTWNWDRQVYVPGTAYGHIAIAVPDLAATCQALEQAGVPIPRPPGPMAHDSRERIAFIEDPDGYRIELIENPTPDIPGEHHATRSNSSA